MDIGRYGIWRGRAQLDGALAATAEDVGFGAIWIGGAQPDLDLVGVLLDATRRITVATGIVNIWSAPARDVAAAFHAVERRHPGRLLLGIGTSHPERVGDAAASPYDAAVRYLDDLESAGIPPARTVLAALGPRMIRLAGERTAGAHPFLSTPLHSRRARDILGDGPLLAPEQRVVLESDRQSALDRGRASVADPYLALRNYRGNLLRLGYSESELDLASDRLVDDLVVWGDPDQVRTRLAGHFEAGADHVAVQLVVEPGEDLAGAHRRLGSVLQLAG